MTKRYLIVYTFCLAFLGMARAQAEPSSYFGVGLVVRPANVDGGAIPLPGFQIGGPVADDLELRGTLDTLLILSYFGVDLLYTFEVSPDVRGYAGGGGDFAYIFLPGLFEGGVFGLRGTVGLELHTGTVGFYGEVQPYTSLVAPILAFKVRTGVNVHF